MLAGCGGWRGFGCQVSQQGPKTTPSTINPHHALLGLLLGGIGHFFYPQRAGWSCGSAVGQSARPAGGFQLGKSPKCARKCKHSGLIPGDIHCFYLLAICPSSSPFLMVFIPAKNGKCTPRSKASCQPGAHTPVSLPWQTPMAMVGRCGIEHQNLEFSTQLVPTLRAQPHARGMELGPVEPALLRCRLHPIPRTPGSPGHQQGQEPFFLFHEFLPLSGKKIAGGKSAHCLLQRAAHSVTLRHAEVGREARSKYTTCMHVPVEPVSHGPQKPPSSHIPAPTPHPLLAASSSAQAGDHPLWVWGLGVLLGQHRGTGLGTQHLGWSHAPLAGMLGASGQHLLNS